MIKIELEFATGAEARQALMDLIGGNINTIAFKTEPAIENEKIAENFEAPKMEVLKDEIPGENSAPKKRRTRAEIEAEGLKKLNAALDPADPEVKDIQDDGINAETDHAKEASKAITADMLKEKAVELIRNNKKPKVIALVKSFGADSVATADKNPIKPEDYVRFMDELNKL